MKSNLFLQVLLLCSLVFALTNCSSLVKESGDPNQMNLTDLLINVNHMPPSPWSVIGPKSTVIDTERTSDLAYIAFFSDLYPDGLSTVQEVFRYQSVWRAKNDYKHAVEEYAIGDVPPNWKFKSKSADESYFACYTYSNIDFPVCFWIARYNRIVIDINIWLIPNRMTMADVEDIVKEIDIKAAKFILGT